MNITSISLSYMFLAIGVIAAIFFAYFKTLYIKTDEKNNSRDKIIGKMKNPNTWRQQNNKMSYLSLFWAIVTTSLFIYLKFFVTPMLISIYYVFLTLVFIAVSIFFTSIKKKALD